MIAQSAVTKRSGFALKASVACALLVTLAGAAVAAALAPRDRDNAKAMPHADDEGATRTLDLSRAGEPVTVTSSLKWGAFNVRPHNQASVTIHVSKKTESGLIEDESVFDTIDFYEDEPNEFVIDVEYPEDDEHVGYSISIYTPVSSSVTLAMGRGGEISVSGLDGDFTLASSNGSVSLMEVSGSASVSAQNGSIEAEFLALNDRPISMATQNGSVDLTVPAAIDAQVSMATQHGAVYSDFELQNIAPARGQDFDGREGSKQWTSASNRAMNGVVGDGGGTISLATQHGAVYLRMGEDGKRRPNHAY